VRPSAGTVELMSELNDLIGREVEQAQIHWALRQLVRELRPDLVGACQVACADEVEWPCLEAFQRWFSGVELPELKSECRAAMHVVNLGARYERGLAPLAEEHFAAAASGVGLKLIVVKINSHVALRMLPDGPDFGWLERYGELSACCGALAAMLEGSSLPSARELAIAFAFGGADRAAVLRNLRCVPVEERALRAAAVNALLQSQRAAEDIAQHVPAGPTVYLILPCVSINREGADGEILLGQWGIDFSDEKPESKYQGLADDPAGYEVGFANRQLVLSDRQWPPS